MGRAFAKERAERELYRGERTISDEPEVGLGSLVSNVLAQTHEDDPSFCNAAVGRAEFILTNGFNEFLDFR